MVNTQPNTLKNGKHISMKQYTIILSKTPEDYIIAGNSSDKTEGIMTFGKTLEEAFDNLADALMTMEGVQVSWWNKLINRLKIY